MGSFIIYYFGISRNKYGQYLKQSFFLLIVLSILAVLIFLRDERYVYFDISIYVGVIILIGYVFSDTKKKE